MRRSLRRMGLALASVQKVALRLPTLLRESPDLNRIRLLTSTQVNVYKFAVIRDNATVPRTSWSWPVPDGTISDGGLRE